MTKKVHKALEGLTIVEARVQDRGHGIARIDPELLKAAGLKPGDIVSLGSTGTTGARVMPTFADRRGERVVLIDSQTRRNMSAELGEQTDIALVVPANATELWLRPLDSSRLSPAQQEEVALGLDGQVLHQGNVVAAQLAGGGQRNFEVRLIRPVDLALVRPETLVKFVEVEQPGKAKRGSISYEEIGGLDREIQRLREMVEVPLRHPQVFEKLGIPPPRGVLLHGPPGTGKTLIARAVASEAGAEFFAISAPEIMQKFYGESEARLRDLFERAQKAAPSIIFIDEVDAIAARRDQVQGEVEKRVVAQLLTLMDGIGGRGDVVVIAATNLPHTLDPALRRPGRFDREVALGLPNRIARRSILGVHSRKMPLAADVELDSIADVTHGFSGADLKALCQEAAMRVVAREYALIRHGGLDAAEYVVGSQDFADALGLVRPSSMRQVLVDIPSTKLDDVGGLHEAKTLLRESILWPLAAPELFERYGMQAARGIVLHGPPGTGKTMLARAVATEAQANFISVSGPELLSRYVGESERAVRELFERARQVAPCVLFFDELDSLAPARGQSEQNGVSDRVVAQLLTELDGLRGRTVVWVMAATNRLEMVDPALLRPGRFDFFVHVPVPDFADRVEILTTLLRGRPVEELDIDAIAGLVEGLSGADLRALCDLASMSALRRSMQEDGGDQSTDISNADFDAGLEDWKRLRANR